MRHDPHEWWYDKLRQAILGAAGIKDVKSLLPPLRKGRESEASMKAKMRALAAMQGRQEKAERAIEKAKLEGKRKKREAKRGTHNDRRQPRR